jgi:GT2 family glycosyltransferase
MLDQVAKGPLDVDWLVGSCLMVRREVIEQVGLLDEGYFMYSEELDWQKRIQDAGWRIVYLPSAWVVHYEGKSSEQVPALTHVRFGRSKVRYYCKHHGCVSGEIVRLWLLLNYLYEWGVEAVKWCVGHKRELRRQRMRAYCRVLRSGL